ncbi:MAG: Hsp20/alpha crystallin family protein [bacterium]
MITKKRSFFERLSGSVSAGSDFDSFDDELPQGETARPATREIGAARGAIYQTEEEPAEGQLPVDVYQTPSEIMLRAFVAGVRAEDLNVSISRDMVVIEGARSAREQISDSDYFNQELFWGSFARKVLLPQEVDVDGSSASAKDGLLTITLPKLDKARQTKLKVKSS